MEDLMGSASGLMYSWRSWTVPLPSDKHVEHVVQDGGEESLRLRKRQAQRLNAKEYCPFLLTH
jgi:hypothetical protein